VYYLENAENLQITLRCKNSALAEMRLENLGAAGEINSEKPLFKFYLRTSVKISESTDGEESEGELEDDRVYDVLSVSGTAKEEIFGKDGDRYRYYALSFGEVIIDYANTKLELFIMRNSPDGEPEFDEDDFLARFTLFDVNMPKTKIPAKKFGLGE